MYRIEITADTLVELSGKVLSLAAQLNATAATFVAPADPVMPEVKPKRTRKGNDAAAETATGTTSSTTTEDDAPQARETQTEAADVSAPADTGNPTPQPSPEATPSVETTTASEAAPEQAKALDFDADVAPVVLAVVAKLGKPVVSEVLEQFGASRASEVDEARWGELVAALKDRL